MDQFENEEFTGPDCPDLLDESDNFGASSSSVVLKTSETKCKVCKTGDLIPDSQQKEDRKFIIYTRTGTFFASHITYR